MKLSDMRKNYKHDQLDDAKATESPLALFNDWMTSAIQANVPEPNAMTLATVSTQSRPSTRIVLLKDFDDQGLVWYTNYQSRKGAELSGNPFAALQFHWVELERVVRIEGQVAPVSPEESDVYFHSRPLQSRIGAWASPQSQEIQGRSDLIKRAATYAAQFMLSPSRPPHWGGYRLQPTYWEFWQGRESRLHDRISYRQQPDGSWKRARLAP